MAIVQTEATIKKWIAELQKIVDEDESRPASIESRIAWLELHLLRRIVEKVEGWESITEDLNGTAQLIRRENNID